MSEIIVNFYNIYAAFDFDKMLYIGKVEINITLLTNKDSIILNGNQFKIIDLKVNNQNYEYSYNQNSLLEEEQVIKINGNFIKYKNTIKILFYNTIKKDTMTGIYYLNKNNKKIIITDFEPNDARKFIPCFDKPNLKSIFNLNIVLPLKYNAVSNTEIKEIKNYDNNKIIKFYETPLMSTYLLCLALGDIIGFENCIISKNNTKINGYTFSEDLDKIEWTIEKIKESLDFFDEWFELNYPLAKLDIVSVPVFGSAAMENWGLIVYKDKYCFYNKNMSDIQKVRLLEVTYHEVSHQWFGNLVTLDDWSNIWLNESTATYFSWMAIENKYPEYFIKDYTFIDRKNIYILDGITNSGKIIVDDKNSDENYFNEITYEKGCSIINYIVNINGISEFRKYVNEYLKKYSYKNTSTNDFIKCFGENKNLLLKMINITNYPMILVKANKLNKTIMIKISKFNLDKEKISNYTANLFLKIKYNGLENQIYLDNNECKLDITNINNLIINPDNDLFCICKYEDYEPDILQMKSCEIIKYCYDEYILALYGYSNLEKYLKVIKKVFDIINLIKYPLLLLSLLEDINKLFVLYNLSNKNSDFYSEFIRNNLYLQISDLFMDCKNILYGQNIISEILILIVINLKNTSILSQIKKEYHNELESKKYYLMDTFIKIMNKYERNNYSLLLTKIDNEYIYDLFISNSNYFHEEDIIDLLNNYKQIINKSEFRDLFNILSKNIKVQNIIIEYIFLNKETLIKEIGATIYYKLLKNVSFNVYYIPNIDMMLKYINSNIDKQHIIVINQIKDILSTNKIVSNNLL
jgi:hypothetical protein